MKEKKLFTATFTFEGKRHYVRSTISQRDADKRAAKKLSSFEDGRSLLCGDMLVRDYAKQWVNTYKSTSVSAPEYQAYQARFRLHILPYIGNMRMKDVRPTHIQSVLNMQVGKSKTHINKIIVAMRSMFAQAIKDHIISDNPAIDVNPPQAVDGTHRSITPSERAAILSVAPTHRFGLFVLITLYAGLRPQETAALTWADIDEINHRIQVRRALKKDNTIGETKSMAGQRDIPIVDPLWNELIKWKPLDLTKPVCQTTKGAAYSHTAIKRGWDSFRRTVDITLGAETCIFYGSPKIVKSVVASDLVLYCLRHTFCTDLEKAGVPINVAKYLMGHSSIVLTSRIYTHMREDTLVDTALKMQEFGATVGATPKPKKAQNQPVADKSKKSG